MRTLAPVLAAVAALVGGLMVLLPSTDSKAATRFAPSFSEPFVRHWNDGKAELSGYRLTQARYGEERAGTAVSIFVKEPFSEAGRIKAGPDRSTEDRFDVMKHNLVEDFQTGIYDYNLLTSSFVGLERSGPREVGAPAKVSFSAQEWCGHAYAQLLFDGRRARLSSHSYFDGEADRLGTLEHKASGLVEDTLLLWARGMAGPVLEPGAERRVPYLLSLKRSRLLHRELAWTEATVQRSARSETIEVPAGSFAVNRLTVAVDDDVTFTLFVEEAFPHRVVRYGASDGLLAELLGSERLPYWELHNNGHEAFLARLGLNKPATAP